MTTPEDPTSPAAAADDAAPRLRGSDVAWMFAVLIVGGITLLVLALGVVTLAGGDARDLTARPLALVAATLVVQTALMAGGVGLVAVRIRGLPWAAVGVRGFRRHWLVTAPVVALALVVVVDFVDRLAGTPIRETEIQMLAPAGFSWGALVLMVAVGGIAAPIGEEMLFRGALYTWLRNKWGVWPAVVGSSVVFGAFHLNPYWAAVTAAVGLALAWVYEKSGSVWPAVIVHGVYNSVGITLIYLTEL